MTGNDSNKSEARARRAARQAASKRITTVAWGVFFIWLALVLMFGWGTGEVLLGVGVLSLAVQVYRKYQGLDSEGFWIVVAMVFLVVGLWEILGYQLPLMALLLLVVGVAFVVSALKGGRQGSRDS